VPVQVRPVVDMEARSRQMSVGIWFGLLHNVVGESLPNLRCFLVLECSFSISTGSHVPTMAFEEERNRFLKPDHVVQKNGKSVSASDNYYIRSFRLLQYGRTTWTPPKLTLWLDFFFSTKNVEFEAITVLYCH
jgi:hypothetical protein